MGKIFARALGLAALGISSFGGSFADTALAGANSPKELGVWYDDTGKGAIKIEQCGAHLCGKIYWLKDKVNAEGKPLIDRHNPNEGQRTRPICGLPVFGGLARAQEGGWDAGWIYDPKEGKSYSVAMVLEKPDKLKVTGYLVMKMMGRSFYWTRAPQDLPACNATAEAAPAKASTQAAQPSKAGVSEGAAVGAAAAAKSAAPAATAKSPAAQQPVTKTAVPAETTKAAAPAAVTKAAVPAATTKAAAPAAVTPSTGAATTNAGSSAAKKSTDTAKAAATTATPSKTVAKAKAKTDEELPWAKDTTAAGGKNTATGASKVGVTTKRAAPPVSPQHLGNDW